MLMTYLSICIAQLNGNIPFQFILETYSLHSRDSLDDGGLSVSDMTWNRTAVCCVVNKFEQCAVAYR